MSLKSEAQFILNVFFLDLYLFYLILYSTVGPSKINNFNSKVNMLCTI